MSARSDGVVGGPGPGGAPPDTTPAGGAGAARADGALDARAWREGNARWLATSLRELRLRLHRQALATRDERGLVTTDWLLAGDDVAGAERATPRSEDLLAALDRRIADAMGQADGLAAELEARWAPPALHQVAALTGLSPLEADILLLAAATSLDGAFAAACAEVQGDSRRDHATLHLALSLFAAGPARALEADALLPGRPLRRLRLVSLEAGTGEPALLRRLGVDDRVADYLRGVNRLDDRLAPYLVPLGVHGGRPGETETGLAATVADRLAARQAEWPTLNLVGAPDAGGRRTAAMACERAGLRPCEVDLARLTDVGPEGRAELIGLMGREAVLADLAVLADASGAVRGTPLAATVDELVRTVGAPLLVLSVDRWPAGDAAVDVVPVPRPGRGEQRDLWRAALARHPNTVNGELDAIVQQFDLGRDAIGEVVDRAARQSAAAITGRALWDACRAQAGPALDDLARRIVPAWGWDDIVVDSDVRDQLRELADQVGHRARVYDTWGFGAQLGRGRGITALFAGQSGTGKTMAAEIIARHLRLDLYRIDLAGVVSKYVGETEKNLRRVFQAAEASGAILLFDEADALFGTRTEVRDSHDRYANLEINYLLQAMEDYAGLAILATNRRSALDAAFVRRLRFIVEFPFPDADARREIWERAFPPAAELDGVDAGALARMELAGGSIRSIVVNAAFLAAAEGAPIRMAHVVRAASREYVKLARPIGAAEFGDWITVARR